MGGYDMVVLDKTGRNMQAGFLELKNYMIFWIINRKKLEGWHMIDGTQSCGRTD